MSKNNFADIIIDKDITENDSNTNYEYMPMFNGLFNIGKDGSGYIFSLEDAAADNKKVIALISVVSDFMPFIKEELSKPENAKIKLYKVLLCLDYKELQNKDKSDKLIFDDKELQSKVKTDNFILFAKDPKTAAGKIITSALDAQKLVNQQARAAAAKQNQIKKQAQLTPGEKLNYEKGETLKTTSTNLANEFFSLAPPITEIDGQLTLNTFYSNKAGQNIAVLSYFSYNDKELSANGITNKEFTDFDYFVAMVCNNLYMENNRKVSLTKLWHEMGNPKAPNQHQIQELRKSLIKGMTTIINISNRDILEAYNINTDAYKDIKSPVMPIIFETEHNRANGYITNETINIYALSPFILVADPLNQITTWKKDILKLYKGSRTARYWRVMRYLMQQIAWMRNDNARAPKITFKTLFDKTGAKRTEDRNATLKIVEDLLKEAFIPCKYISSYNIDHQKGVIELVCIKALPENKNQ